MIVKNDIEIRNNVLSIIENHSRKFNNDYKLLQNEIERNSDTILTHIRFCGVIPEYIQHDSTEEKLYSKYTDIVLSIAYNYLGLTANVLESRGNSADVECINQYDEKFSFVADAKAFRISRTAKNQKDFKIKAMDSWKFGKPFAMLVAPIYQIPAKSGQIYEQATTSNVCIFSYSHLAILINYANNKGQKKSIELLKRVFIAIRAMNPNKSAMNYWQTVNELILNYDNEAIVELWNKEKLINKEIIDFYKKQALEYLAHERERIMRLSRKKAISELLRLSKIENKINKISKVSDNELLDL